MVRKLKTGDGRSLNCVTYVSDPDKMMVEAAGVEPASEKARPEETTCVSGPVVVGRRVRTGRKATA